MPNSVQSVLFPSIQFCISIVFFIYTQLNVKTVLFQMIPFSVIRFQCQKQIYFKQFWLASETVPFQIIQSSVSMQFKCQNTSISSNSV